MITKFLLMFIFPIACVLAHDKDSLPTLRKARATSTIEKIVTKQAESIQYYDGKRLYLKAEKIYLTEDGPALCNGSSAILLTTYLPTRAEAIF